MFQCLTAGYPFRTFKGLIVGVKLQYICTALFLLVSPPNYIQIKEFQWLQNKNVANPYSRGTSCNWRMAGSQPSDSGYRLTARVQYICYYFQQICSCRPDPLAVSGRRLIASTKDRTGFPVGKGGTFLAMVQAWV
jgi:hypothetical protein